MVVPGYLFFFEEIDWKVKPVPAQIDLGKHP